MVQEQAMDINFDVAIGCRSDVRQAGKDKPKPARKSKLDAMQVLNKLSWVTTEPVDTACILLNDDEERSLTNAEWGAQMRMSMLGVRPSAEYWMLLHENSGLLPDSNPMPRVRAISTQATVRDILEAIENMTVNDGPYEIADHVYFEGIRKIADGLFSVNTGS